ncbi:unnamed protein product [Polarella glacialis]|uniref:Uncharacterized protein n=1 Tax=Polarella glacialis TaxID=89957 RepID=A0A813J8N1_POLGL|nr:unnamed protein product [Polarella glacialis]
MVIPEEPFVHKFVWASRTFGGYDAEPYYNARAPEDLRRLGGQTSDSSVFGKHPPFHPTNLLQAWMMHRFMDDRRYWYQYTEWATLPHLLRFSSLASLMERLSALTREEGRRVSALMANHHAVMVADALGWWRAALSDLITDLDLRQ